MSLHQFILDHTAVSEPTFSATVGDPFEMRGTPPSSSHAELMFMNVSLVGNPDPVALTALLKSHRGEFCDMNIFDNAEHSYIELGGWVGDQGLALRLMGAMSLLGLAKLFTPVVILPSISREQAIQMAGLGMITIICRNQPD